MGTTSSQKNHTGNSGDSEIRKIFADCPAGYIVESEDAEAYSKSLVNFVLEPITKNKFSAARDYVLSNFDRSEQANKINDIIEKTIKKS